MHFTVPLLSALSIASASPLVSRYTAGTTANDLKDGECNPVTFIFARGSTEPGNIGISVGPSVAKKLKEKLGKVTIQGVDYTASIASNVEMGRGGGPVMAQLAKEAKQKCPSTKVFVGGYSQGCEVVHYAAKHEGMNSDYVDGAVLYGDPEDGIAHIPGISADNIKEFCAAGDGVCELHGFDITAGHLSYTTNGDTTKGADWIVQKAGSASSSSPSSYSGSDSSDTSGTASAAASSSTASSGGLLGSLMGGGSSESGDSDSSDSSDSSGSSDSSDSSDLDLSDLDSSDSSDSSGSSGSKFGLSSLLPKFPRLAFMS